MGLPAARNLTNLKQIKQDIFDAENKYGVNAEEILKKQ